MQVNKIRVFTYITSAAFPGILKGYAGCEKTEAPMPSRLRKAAGAGSQTY